MSTPTAAATAALLAALVALNGVAVVNLLAAREGARNAAREDLALETQVHAHTLEAVLATLRADLIFLTQAPPLARAAEAYTAPDPVTRRWARLDLEGTLLLFLEAHPPVTRLLLRDPRGGVRAAAGRRQGAAVYLRRDEIAAAPPASLLYGSFALPGPASWHLEAWADPERLLGMAAPGLGDRLRVRRPGEPVAEVPPEEVAVTAPVDAASWRPPFSWQLVRRERADRLIQSFESLAEHYRFTVVLNAGIVALALLLGALALREVRRGARLEAEARHREERRELERQLQHSERLASVGRLAAGIAHEINNPLEGMANYLALLDEDLRRGDTREAGLLAGRVREGLERAAGIVRQVLAFADPGRGPRSPLDLHALVERTLDFVRANPEFRGIEVAPLQSSDGALTVLGNPTTLGQLVLNLLINACQACQAQPAGGRVEVSLAAAGESARLTVEDRGPGLDPETEARLFEPFYSTKGSTGLGLAVCHGIVADHGGRLRAANRPQGGARFVVELPLG